ncbi:MAG TPA: hypothetical protein VHV57_06140 [Acidimicrobiales bacterium]|jgi:DNA-directed RNA polymerase subunit RPC12/RpoP|nr:hypothetical protein [Acidimicrobiales bacterium]
MTNHSTTTLVAITCPDCRTPFEADPNATSVECPHCTKLIRSVHCGVCGRFFATVNRRDSQCPRCLNTLRAGEGESTFAELSEQRSTPEAVVDHETLATTAPNLFGSQKPRRTGRMLAIVAALIIVAVVVLLISHKSSHNTGAVTAPCLPVSVNHTITFTRTKDAQGNYQVSASGSVTNNTSTPLDDLFVKWQVTSFDLSTSVPTLTPVNGVVGKGARVTWHGTATGNDGPVPPIVVHVLGVVEGGPGTTCKAT